MAGLSALGHRAAGHQTTACSVGRTRCRAAHGRMQVHIVGQKRPVPGRHLTCFRRARFSNPVPLQ